MTAYTGSGTSQSRLHFKKRTLLRSIDVSKKNESFENLLGSQSRIGKCSRSHSNANRAVLPGNVHGPDGRVSKLTPCGFQWDINVGRTLEVRESGAV